MLSALVSLEVVLRLAEPHGALLRRLLHRSGERPHFEELDSLEELLAATSFHATPFVDWGGWKVNSHGLRTHEYAREKDPGTYRIVVLGDSFAFDSGFVPWNEIWHHLVGKRLAEDVGRPVEVINLGVPAVGPGFYLRMFELEGSRLAPDLVLVSLFVGNDLIDESGTRGSLLQRWSYAWRFLSLLVRHPQAFRGAGPFAAGPGGHPIAGAIYDPEIPLNDEATFLRIARETARIFAIDSRAEIEASIADTVEVLRRLDRAVRRSGARLVAVLIPDRIQLDDGLRGAALSGNRKEYDFDWIQAALGDRLAGAGISTIDLLPAFRDAQPAPRLYRRFDSHWSAHGNRLAAERIASGLR